MAHFVLQGVDRSMTAAQRLDERPGYGKPAAAERGRVRGHLACGRVGKFQSITLVRHGGVTI
jgi:hypothetical protein